MIKQFVLLLLAASLVYGLTFGGPAEVANSRLLSHDFNSVELFFSSGNLEITEISNAHGRFTILDMSGTSPSSEIGVSELPVYRTFVEIPQNAEISVEVVDMMTRTINLGTIWFPEAIYPRQAPVPKTRGYKPEFVIDREFYRQERQQFDSIVEITGIIQARDHRLAQIEIHPVNYNPALGRIEILESARIKIETAKADIEQTRQIKERQRSVYYDRIIEPHIINSDFYRMLWVVPTEIEMLIIVGDSYSSLFTDLINWKTRKGFKIDFKTASELGGTANSIKTYIQSQYTGDDVDFVLIVGDVADVPTFDGGDSHSSSDNPYSELAGGDYIPDCFVGRLSMNSSAQVTEMLDRIIDYEHFAFGTGTGWTQGTCIPASDDGSFHDIAEATQRYVAQTYFGPHGYTRIDTIWAYYGGTGAQVISSINAGIMLLDYTGHGYNGGWAGPDMDQNDVRNLTNQGMYPMVFSHACLTGTFGEYSECFMETWIRQSDKGAIASMGASNSSYWDEDDVMERRTIDSVFVGEWMFTAGMRFTGLVAVHNAHPGSAEYYFDMYNLLGDPSVALWWNIPQAISVEHPMIGAPGGETLPFTVTSEGSPVEDALVCITDDSAIHEAAYTNSSGFVNLTYSGAIIGDTLWVTVTAYNKTPYEGYITIGGAGPFVIYENHTVQDDGGYGSSGDGDTISDVQETIALWVNLYNAGTEQANDVSAILSSTSPYASILDNNSSFGNIPAESSAGAIAPFLIQLQGTPTDDTDINFDLDISDDAGSTWTAQFAGTIHAPLLELSEHNLLDLGDGDGFYEPGEQIAISVTLHNAGGEHALGVAGSLSEDDPNAYLIISEGSFGTFPPDSYATHPTHYRLQINPACPTPNFVKIVHSAYDTRGYITIDTLTILIGTGGFFDDAEAGEFLWNAETPWHVTEFRRHSSEHSFYAGNESGDSPFQHANETNSSMITDNPIILPNDPALTFWHFYHVENNYDFCYVEVSTDGGTGWSELLSFTGPSKGWKFAYADLSAFGSPGDQILLRYRLDADGGVHCHGWFIDDVSVESIESGYIGAGDVFPWAGKAVETFTFKVTYASPNAVLPTSATVNIDGIPYSMTDFEGAIATGMTFSYSTTLTSGLHEYYYEIQVDAEVFRFPESGTIQGPFVGEPIYGYDFGTLDGSFTTQSFEYSQDWVWEAPTYGPGSVPYGTSCWGTNPAGEYTDTSQSRIISPEIALPSDAGIPYLIIWHWYRAQANDIPMFHDGGNVKLTVDGGEPFVIFPQEGYDGTASQYNNLNAWEPIYGDTLSDFWQEEAFNLAPWIGHSVQIMFDFGASYRNVEAGWYLNYAGIFTSIPTAIDEPIKPIIPGSISLAISPNPFNASCRIIINNDSSFEIPKYLEIYDISGKKVDVLGIEPGQSEISWKPGSQLTSGIYFVKIPGLDSKLVKPAILLK